MEQRTARRGTRQRLQTLLSLVRRGVTRVDDLARELSVSPSTVRRDLNRLGAEHQIARTYGGAVVPEVFHERPVADSARLRTRAKAAIARAALSLSPVRGTIFIDAGTTCAALAHLIAARTQPQDLTVVTRGLEIALALTDRDDIETVILGGRVRSLSHAVVGPLSTLGVERMSFDVAFMGADVVDLHRGVGEPTLEETTLKESVARRAGRVVVLADHSKLRGPDAPAWTNFDPGWTLATDGDPDGRLADAARRADVTLVTAVVD